MNDSVGDGDDWLNEGIEVDKKDKETEDLENSI